MTKTILLTGATDGIGFETAKRLAALGHDLLLHGRSDKKLADVETAVLAVGGGGRIERVRADLSTPAGVIDLVDDVTRTVDRLDVIINNAGVFNVPDTTTADGLDVRFAVNTIAPYLITRRLLPIVPTDGRIVNLSSAAQAPVDLDAMVGPPRLDAGTAYAQSKLAITMWSFHLAAELDPTGPAVIAVNPGSFLATKMVREGYGVTGNDIGIGADVLVRAALSDDFADASGRYFDNDSGAFAPPHPDALDPARNRALVERVESIIDTVLSGPRSGG